MLAEQVCDVWSVYESSLSVPDEKVTKQLHLHIVRELWPMFFTVISTHP